MSSAFNLAYHPVADVCYDALNSLAELTVEAFSEGREFCLVGRDIHRVELRL
jgi:hypothetical protein